MCDKGNEGKNRTEQNDVCRLFGIWLFSFWFFLSLYFHSQVVFFSVFILCFITLLFAVFYQVPVEYIAFRQTYSSSGLRT